MERALHGAPHGGCKRKLRPTTPGETAEANPRTHTQCLCKPTLKTQMGSSFHDGLLLFTCFNSPPWKALMPARAKPHLSI